MMPFGDWSWRVMIMRSSFEDASQGPRMVCSVGRSVDVRAGCAVPVRSSSSHSEQARRHGVPRKFASAVQIFLEMNTSRFFGKEGGNDVDAGVGRPTLP